MSSAPARSTRSASCSSGTRTRSRRTIGSCSRKSRLVDMARKVIGVGSVGTRCRIIPVGQGRGGPAAHPGQGGRAVGSRRVRREDTPWRVP
ncbi:DUF2252 family protein [Streptomyces stackebrandtii]|uniref:DUF2252 family protein n=1 Tax=Streptomyces stackebrandtii TaxID=3051177 RepID=UPI0028DC3EBE|nr:DUF2252 family protein [Streptomyces sp. DSM 40976]